MYRIDKMIKVLIKIGLIATMILTMSGLMTSVMTYAGLPEGQRFIDAWLPVWMQAALVIAPAGFALMYLISETISAVFPDMAPGKQNIILGASMALVMESVMASVTTLQLHGWSTGFMSYWINILLSALPVAVLASLAMTFLIKPRIDKILAA